MLKIFLIRHGEALGNRERKLVGREGGGLTEDGAAQAERVGKLLSKFELDHILSSPVRRCVETASRISHLNGVEIREDARLAERNLGPYDGLTIKEVEALRRKAGHEFIDPTQDWEGVEAVEQDSDVFDRFRSLTCELSTHDGCAVAMVTHAGVVKSVISRVMNLPERKSCVVKVASGSVSLLEGPDPFWMLRFLSVPNELLA